MLRESVIGFEKGFIVVIEHFLSVVRGTDLRNRRIKYAVAVARSAKLAQNDSSTSVGV